MQMWVTFKQSLIHRSGYNLKRKIASLAPISVEVFDRDVSKSREVGATNTADRGISRPGAATERISSDSRPQRVTIEKEYRPLQCLFCNIELPTMDDNVEHMYKVHGMFVPNREDLEDAEGLLLYLFNIISELHECLYCGKTKETAEGIKSHMIDKGHCNLAFDEELDRFYDFEGEAEVETRDAQEQRAQGDEDVGANSVSLGYYFLTDFDLDLHLPSGRVLGHRSLSRYYRQNLHSYPTPSERAERRALTAAGAANGETPVPDHPGRQLATSARGEMGMIGVSEFDKRAVRATEQRALKAEARARNEHEWRVSKESNHQKHYRVNGLGVLLLG